MKQQELWNALASKRVHEFRGLGKKFVVVPTEHFKIYRDEFRPSPNVFTEKQTYRSTELVRHIHAVERGNVVVLHRDHGNVDRSLLLGLLHLVADAIPYGTWSLGRQKRRVSKVLESLEGTKYILKE